MGTFNNFETLADDLPFRYNMLAGIADPGNSFFLVPVVHFPWSEKARMEKKAKTDENGDSV